MIQEVVITSFNYFGYIQNINILGITGRLNGAGAEAFWGQSTPHAGPQPIHHHSKLPVGPANGTGWEEPSPPTQRRTMPNYDDGTSLWGNPQQGKLCFKNLFCFKRFSL